MCLYLYYIYRITIHRTHIYYVNKNIYFGCDQYFDSTNIFNQHININSDIHLKQLQEVSNKKKNYDFFFLHNKAYS